MELQYLTDPVRQLYRRLFPAAAGSLLTASVASLIDALVLSNFLGPIMLSAVSICMPIYMLLNSMAMLIASGGATIYAFYLGKGDRTEANRFYTVSFIAVLGVGLLFTAFGLMFTDDIVRALGANDAIYDITYGYARVLMYFMVPLMLYSLMLFFVRFDSDPNLTLIATLACAAVNLVLDVAFVGWFKWGAVGAALATCLAYSIALLINCTHFLKKINTLKLSFSGWKFERLLRSIKAGAPLSVSQFGMALCTSIFNILIIGAGGENMVAIYAIITQISMIAMATYEGVGQAAQPIFSANLGAGDHARIRATFRFGMVFELVATGICLALLLVLAEPLARLFAITDPAMLAQATAAIRVYALALPVTGINVFIMYYFQSRENSLRATVISLMHSSLGMIAALYALLLLFPVDSIWYTWLLAEILTLAVSAVLMKNYKEDA